MPGRPRLVSIPAALALLLVAGCGSAQDQDQDQDQGSGSSSSASSGGGSSTSSSSTSAPEVGTSWEYGSTEHGPTASLPAEEPSGATLRFETGTVGSRAVITRPDGDRGCPGEVQEVLAEPADGPGGQSSGMDADDGSGTIMTVVSPVEPLWEVAQQGPVMTVTTTCESGEESVYTFAVAGLDTDRMSGFPQG